MSTKRPASPYHFQVVPLSEVPSETQPETTELRRPIVLVVDDDSMVADTLSTILARENYGVLTAYDAESALELIATVAPDVLLTDIQMPGMDGVQLALALVQALPHCKVLLCTGSSIATDLTPIYAAGHDFPLLHKPIHPSEILRHVARCLSTLRETPPEPSFKTDGRSRAQASA